MKLCWYLSVEYLSGVQKSSAFVPWFGDDYGQILSLIIGIVGILVELPVFNNRGVGHYRTKDAGQYLSILQRANPAGKIGEA